MNTREMRHGLRSGWGRAGGWLAAAALAGGVAGCGAGSRTPEVDDARTARLPAEDRQALLEEQRDLDRVETNLDTIQVAVEEAEQFRSIVETEHQAAEQNLEAAREAVELAERAGDRQPDEEAREREQIAEAQVTLTEERSKYAESLLELRQAQAQEVEAERALAKARLERVRFERLQAREMHEDLEAEDFMEAEQRALQDLEQARERVSTLESQVDAQARRVDQLQQEAQANGRMAAPVVEPPEPPQLLDAPEAQEQPGAAPQ
jgi:chromosome segregation ATPase